MSLIIPFNHQPILKGVSTTTYTPTAGRYARVVVTLIANAFATAAMNSSGTVPGAVSYVTSDGLQNDSFEIWITDAETLTGTTAVASSAGATTFSTGGTFLHSQGGTSSASVLQNAVTIASVSARSLAVQVSTVAGSGTINIATISGEASFRFNYEEYKELT